MNTTGWKRLAVATILGVSLGASGVFAFGPGVKLTPQNIVLVPAPVLAQEPPAKGKPADEWLVKGSPPSAFPELGVKVDPNDKDAAQKAQEQFAKITRRLRGDIEIAIAPADDALRKLIKARLYRGVLELNRYLEMHKTGKWNQAYLSRLIDCLTDMRAAATELWGGQPKELVPWLEEFVIMAKYVERFTTVRVEIGTAPPQDLDAAIRHRLAAEAALWKAKKAA
jgi:hypothetical protein